MNKKELTKAFILNNYQPSDLKLNLSLLELNNIDDFPYLLVIQSTSPNFSKITIYPLKKKKIVKISLSGVNISDKVLENLIQTLQNFEIIHTSGLLIKDNKLTYECYLNTSLSEAESIGLKDSLDIIRNNSIVINIDEVGLI